MFVKICGVTNREDALAAVDAGASAIGFNFYRESPRYISPTGAAMIGEKLPHGLQRGVVERIETRRFRKFCAFDSAVCADQHANRDGALLLTAPG